MNFWVAARTAAFLSLLFLVVYGGSNWLSSQRSDVGTLFFEWERRIPFVPWMIVPYMSIDLFFVAAPFLCRDQNELRVLSQRIVFAIVAAGVFFLLFPLRFAFERPSAEGWLGVVFDWFRSVDQPYNLLPSLHITLRTILGAVYVRRTTGLWRLGVDLWFSLIAISTVLTYQHHIMDVAGGFALAAACFYFVREEPTRLPVIPNRRVGTYYAIGGLAMAALAIALVGWGVLWLWPALACGILALAYFGEGPGVYRKKAGLLPLSSRCVLGPALIGQWLSLRHYQRQCRPWDEAAPGVWIGRVLNRREASGAVNQGVTAVLDLTAEFSETEPFRRARYLNVPILDLTAPNQEQLRALADFIAAESARGIVYVHCKIGYSRSAAAVGAFLLATQRAPTVEDALGILRRVRPSIVIRPEVVQALEQFQRVSLANQSRIKPD